MPADQQLHLPIGIWIGSTVVFYIVTIFFCLSLFKGMNRVPKDKQLFPAWLVWLMLIPLVNYVIMWMMIPFGVPKSFKAATLGNDGAQKNAKTLFAIGLTYAICVTLTLVPVINIATSIAALVLFIIYWVKVCGFKKQFLTSGHNSSSEPPPLQQ